MNEKESKQFSSIRVKNYNRTLPAVSPNSCKYSELYKKKICLEGNKWDAYTCSAAEIIVGRNTLWYLNLSTTIHAMIYDIELNNGAHSGQ